MAKRAMMKGMTTMDRVVAWAMMAGIVIALVQYGQAMALPRHFA